MKCVIHSLLCDVLEIYMVDTKSEKHMVLLKYLEGSGICWIKNSYNI
jgi:hypothetical protein